MKVVVWNVRGALESSDAWDYLRELKPDLALLQEVGAIPQDIRKSLTTFDRKAMGPKGIEQRFSTAILIKGKLGPETILRSKWNWVNRELEYFAGNLISREAELYTGEKFNVVSVYSPAWSIDPKRFLEVDQNQFNALCSIHSREFMVTELLWSALQNASANALPWIVGGDFNISETFETKWPNGPHGVTEFLQRMADLGFIEGLRHSNKKIVPTFRHSRGKFEDQIDHIFLSGSLRNELESCVTGDSNRVFKGSLSDHVPIIANLSLNPKHKIAG